MESNRIHYKWLILFCVFWVLLRLPFILYPINLLNADVAVQLLMAMKWPDTWSKFMWGSSYLGTLESTWNALCYKLIPVKAPFAWIPTLMLGLLGDLFFLKSASKILSQKSLWILSVFLIFLPPVFLHPQVEPNLSYTTITLLCLLAIWISSPVVKGVLLGLAFYEQPISVYFILPLLFNFALARETKKLFWMGFGFSLPLLFAALPFAGPSMDFSILTGAPQDQRHILAAFKLFLSTIAAFFGYLPQKFMDTPVPILVFSFTALTLFGWGLIQKRKIFFESLQNLSLSHQHFAKVLAFQILFIPLLFIFRKHPEFDGEIVRYLWLWHYALYFFVAYLLGEFISSKQVSKKIFTVLFVAIFMSLSLSQTGAFWKRENPDLAFTKTIEYLRNKNIKGVVGEYWAVYPIAYFTQADEEAIKAFPLQGVVRIQKMELPISILSNIAYLCVVGNPSCLVSPPDKIKLGFSNFVKSEGETPLTFESAGKGIFLQMYEKDFDF